MEGEILQRNLEAIAQYNPFYIDELLATDFSLQEKGAVFETGTFSTPTAYFCHNDRRLLLHSRYDPEAEAIRIIGDIEATRDYLFLVFGIGLGHHLFTLKNKISPETRVVIIEHNIDILRYALNHIDFSELFSSGQFVLMFGDEQQIGKMAAALGSLDFYKLVHNAHILSLPNYYVYSEQNKAAVQQIYKVLLNVFLSHGNDLEDHFFGFDNMCHNHEAIMNGYSINDIKGKYKDVPAIIVASGPSLDKNIQYLKEANGKALIIACDASLRACERHGVQPDAIATIERVIATYQFFYQGRSFPDDLVLFAPGSVWPDIVTEYPGKIIFASRNDTGFENLWTETLDNFQFLNMGHSCATLAFAAARVAGCNPIILVGQDLAYTSGKKHSDLTHTFEFEGANDDRDAGGVYVEDHEGNLLKSSLVFRLFKEWFEMIISRDNRLHAIDATEGGAYIKGTTLMPLKEAIETYCNKTVGKRLVEILPDKKTVTSKEKRKKYDLLLKIINRNLTLLNRIKKSAEVHRKRLSDMEKALPHHQVTAQLEKDVLKMQRGDKLISMINGSAALGAYYSPIILQTIIQVRKIGNELTADNVRRNHALQQNLMYMISHSTDLIIQEYNKAKSILEQKRNAIDG